MCVHEGTGARIIDFRLPSFSRDETELSSFSFPSFSRDEMRAINFLFIVFEISVEMVT